MLGLSFAMTADAVTIDGRQFGALSDALAFLEQGAAGCVNSTRRLPLEKMARETIDDYVECVRKADEGARLQDSAFIALERGATRLS